MGTLKVAGGVLKEVHVQIAEVFRLEAFNIVPMYEVVVPVLEFAVPEMHGLTNVTHDGVIRMTPEPSLPSY